MNKYRILIFFVAAILLFGCSDNDTTGGNKTTRMEIRLTDAPAPYDEVNIDIRSIAVNTGNDEESGWLDMNLIEPGIYNLLNFRNGIDTLLASKEIPAGRINQIRLLLGDNNTIVKNGIEYPLETPSAQQSGIKLNVHENLISDIVYRLWIDFDASRSIVETGSGKYLLKPVIRTYTEATGGTIKGYILPLGVDVSVWAILGTDSILAYPEDNGFYLFPGLAPGSTWKLYFDANESLGFKDIEKTGITVSTGVVTDIETVNFEQ